MKNKNIRLLTLSFMLFVLFLSCERIEEIKLPIPPNKIILNLIPEVKGELGEYIIANNEEPVQILLKENQDDILYGYDYSLDVLINFINAIDVKAGKGYNYYGPSLKLELLDKQGNKINGFHAKMKTSYTDLAENLNNEKSKEWITFSGHYTSRTSTGNIGDEAKEFIDNLSQGYFVRLKSEIIEEKERSSSSATKSTTKSSESLDSKGFNNGSSFNQNSESNETKIDKGKCNKFLNQYEEFVLEYVKIAKIVAKDPNDKNYMRDISNLSKKIQDIEGSLENCKSDPEVAKKFVKIQKKMLDAAF